jgi:phage-related protein (TIGR01555 family)
MKKVIHSKREEQRNDGWSNVLTLLGTGADKRMHSKIEWDPRDPEFFEQLYAGGGIPARIVDLIPQHALRHWIEWQDLSPAKEKERIDICNKLNVRAQFSKAWTWGRAYGGGLLYIVTDTPDPSSPLELGEKVIGLQDLSRWDVRTMTTDVEFDMGSPNFGCPRIYYLNVQMGSQFKGYPIHWTRMQRFDGQIVPRRTYIRNNYWHDSTLNRIYNSIRNYEMANDAAAACLLDFNVDVFKMKNLSNLIAAGKEKVVKDRIEMVEFVKSVINAVIIDADNEEYDNKSRSLEGVADLLNKQADRLVADTDIPHTILLGESPDGSNATGNSTSQNWYNMLATEQENYARPKLDRLFSIIFPEDDVSYKFKSMRVLDDAEKADLHLKQAQADQIYLDKQVLDPSEVAQSRFGGKEYSIETEVDWKGRASGDIVPGSNDLSEEGSDGDDESDDDDERGGGTEKKDDLFHIAGDQPPEGKSKVAASPSEPEPGGALPKKEMSAEGDGIEGLFISRKNPGTQYDLRNEEGDNAGTDPKITSFISQTMSEPMRDPRTDPHIKGPGIPNRARTVLPTRGTGVVAQSGYDIEKDPKLQDESPREGVEGEANSLSGQEGLGRNDSSDRRRAATIIVRRGDHFLMGPTHENGRWTMPGGMIEDGESVHQGALRELEEETGLKAGKLKYLGTRLVESEKDQQTEVAMYEHHVKDGVRPTHKKDPDKEVSGWKWLNSKEPLSQDVLGNLKHANNVALDHMGLLK